MTEIEVKKETLSRIDYRDYPEFMFAIIASYLPEDEGDDLRRVAGKVAFRHDRDGCNYKNGVLHSYNDLPAYTRGKYQVWYRDGKLHREGDSPAIIDADTKIWFKNGLIHRDGDKPALISSVFQTWYKDGVFYRHEDF